MDAVRIVVGAAIRLAVVLAVAVVCAARTLLSVVLATTVLRVAV